MVPLPDPCSACLDELFQAPLLIEYGTYKKVKAILWPCLAAKSPEHPLRCCLFAWRGTSRRIRAVRVWTNCSGHRMRQHAPPDVAHVTHWYDQQESVRTGSWMGPPQGKRAPRVGPISIVILTEKQRAGGHPPQGPDVTVAGCRGQECPPPTLSLLLSHSPTPSLEGGSQRGYDARALSSAEVGAGSQGLAVGERAWTS